MAGFSIHPLSAAEVRNCADALGRILIDCVRNGASVSYMWPLAEPEAVRFFLNTADSIQRGERVLLAAMQHGEPVGCVQLITAMPPNQPHRAEIAKLLVHSKARRQGIAQALMQAAEDAARAASKSLLVLDTSTGSDAERLYVRLGWTKCGEIPDYALLPTGEPHATSFFWKYV
jgi:ribosomal protein S18 acetylase RimI-like enzyme